MAELHKGFTMNCTHFELAMCQVARLALSFAQSAHNDIQISAATLPLEHLSPICILALTSACDNLFVLLRMPHEGRVGFRLSQRIQSRGVFREALIFASNSKVSAGSERQLRTAGPVPWRVIKAY